MTILNDGINTELPGQGNDFSEKRTEIDPVTQWTILNPKSLRSTDKGRIYVLYQIAKGKFHVGSYLDNTALAAESGLAKGAFSGVLDFLEGTELVSHGVVINTKPSASLIELLGVKVDGKPRK